jgi:hypothetical protein
MKRIMFSTGVAGLLVLAITVFLTSCFPQPDISGTYTTAVHARQGNGRGWNGRAEILLTQTGASLTGHITLHHPAAGTVQIPITSGSVQDGKVVFFGHTNLPLGTVDLKFTGVATTTRIEGAVNVELHLLFGEEQDTATLYLSKA